MVEDTTVDTVLKTAKPNPAAPSLASGTVGTITSLKRGGLAGDTGYVTGVVSCEALRQVRRQRILNTEMRKINETEQGA